MRCFVRDSEAFGLAGNGEPLEGLGREHDMIRCLVQKDGFGKAVFFTAVS